MGMYGPEFVWILNPNAGTVDEWVDHANNAKKKIETQEQICNKTQYQKALNRAFTFKALMIRGEDNFTTSSNLVRIFIFVNAAPSVDLILIQSTPDNSNLQGKSKKGSSYREFELPGVRRKSPRVR